MSPSETRSDARGATLWRGFHHIALVTRDLDGTIRFYRDILGMQVGDIMMHPQGGRHCFINPGSGETETWGLHFFEEPNAQEFTDPKSPITVGFIPGALQHIAFVLPDEANALALHKRLQSYQVVMTGINEVGPIRNILFRDNNGILLEATWFKIQAGANTTAID